jgi:hypothetical protein
MEAMSIIIAFGAGFGIVFLALRETGGGSGSPVEVPMYLTDVLGVLV